MIPEILSYLALGASIAAATASFLYVRKNKRSQDHLAKMISKYNKDYLTFLDVLKKEDSKFKEKLKEMPSERQVISITEDQLNEIQKWMKQYIVQLDQSEQKYVMPPIYQPSIKGKVDYLNKIFHLSGHPENIVIVKDRQ